MREASLVPRVRPHLLRFAPTGTHRWVCAQLVLALPPWKAVTFPGETACSVHREALTLVAPPLPRLGRGTSRAGTRRTPIYSRPRRGLSRRSGLEANQKAEDPIAGIPR